MNKEAIEAAHNELKEAQKQVKYALLIVSADSNKEVIRKIELAIRALQKARVAIDPI